MEQDLSEGEGVVQHSTMAALAKLLKVVARTFKPAGCAKALIKDANFRDTDR
jgi:hypothetical protein